MLEIFKFYGFFEATKKDNFKKPEFLFFFYYIGISLITILEKVTGWRHTTTFVMNNVKTEKMCFFEVTTQKHHKLMHRNDNQWQ